MNRGACGDPPRATQRHPSVPSAVVRMATAGLVPGPIRAKALPGTRPAVALSERPWSRGRSQAAAAAPRLFEIDRSDTGFEPVRATPGVGELLPVTRAFEPVPAMEEVGEPWFADSRRTSHRLESPCHGVHGARDRRSTRSVMGLFDWFRKRK